MQICASKIILPSIILPLTTDDFRSHRGLRQPLTGKQKSFCPPIILSQSFDVGKEDKMMKGQNNHILVLIHWSHRIGSP